MCHVGIACTALVWQVTTLLLVAPPCGGGGVSRAAELTGAISPVNPLVAVNDSLVINCTLSRAHDGAIYFKFGSARLPQQFVRRVDARTAELRLANMTRRHSHAHIFCYVDGEDNSLSSVVVTVAEKPARPTITTCRVYNWSRMVCRWEPAEQHTGIATNQTLYWTVFSVACDALFMSLTPRERARGQWERAAVCRQRSSARCPRPSPPSTCTWLKPDPLYHSPLLLDKLYHIEVEAVNRLGAASTVVYVDTGGRVEPDPVTDLRVARRASPRSIALRWTPPTADLINSLERILFSVTYTDDDDLDGDIDGQRSQTKNTTASAITLTGLYPGREYVVRVRCIPWHDDKDRTVGFWSNTTRIRVKTKDTVLWVSPAVTAGSFYTSDLNRTHRSIILHWQVVPPEQRYGRIVGVRVNCSMVDVGQSKPGCPGQVIAFVVGAAAMSVNLTLCRDVEYGVTVDAKTTVGFNESLRPDVVTIATEADMPPSPTTFVVRGNETGVYLDWMAVKDATGYTVYWCEGTPYHMKCKGELQWRSCPSNTRSLTMSLNGSHYSNYIFAISVQWVGPGMTDSPGGGAGGGAVMSGGMLWSTCTYEVGGDVPAPVVAFSGRQQGESLAVVWKVPTCTDIASFILKYCRSDDDHCHPDDVREVSVKWPAHEYIIKDLDGDETYRVQVLSKSLSGKTAQSEWIATEVLRSDAIIVSQCTPPSMFAQIYGLTEGQIAFVVVATIVGFSLIIIGLVATIRCCKRSIEKYKTLPIVLPERFVRHIPEEDEEYDTSSSRPAVVYYLTNTSAQSHLRQNRENHERERGPVNCDKNKDGGCNGDYSAAASVYSADTTLTSLDSADSGDTYVSSRVYASPPPLCAVQEEEMNAGGDDDMDQRLTEPAEESLLPSDKGLSRSDGDPERRAPGGDPERRASAGDPLRLPSGGDPERRAAPGGDLGSDVYVTDISSYSRAATAAGDPGYVTLPDNCNNANNNPHAVASPADREVGRPLAPPAAQQANLSPGVVDYVTLPAACGAHAGGFGWAAGAGAGAGAGVVDGGDDVCGVGTSPPAGGLAGDWPTRGSSPDPSGDESAASSAASSGDEGDSLCRRSPSPPYASPLLPAAGAAARSEPHRSQPRPADDIGWPSDQHHLPQPGYVCLPPSAMLRDLPDGGIAPPDVLQPLVGQ